MFIILKKSLVLKSKYIEQQIADQQEVFEILLQSGLNNGIRAKSFFKYGLTFIASMLLNPNYQSDINIYIFLSRTQNLLHQGEDVIGLLYNTPLEDLEGLDKKQSYILFISLQQPWVIFRFYIIMRIGVDFSSRACWLSRNI